MQLPVLKEATSFTANMRLAILGSFGFELNRYALPVVVVFSPFLHTEFTC